MELSNEQLKEANSWLRGRVAVLEESMAKMGVLIPAKWAVQYHRLSDERGGYVCTHCLEVSDSGDDLDLREDPADLEHLPNCPVGMLLSMDM